MISTLLSAHRLVPAIITSFSRKHEFLSGYPTFFSLVDAFTVLRNWQYQKIGGTYGSLGWWEYDMFIGSVAFIFLIVFVTAYGLQRHNDNKNHLQVLYIPIIIMILLSLGDIYSIITKVPLPLMNTERISSRFIIVPVMFCILIACVKLQQIISTDSFETQLLFLLPIFLIAIELFHHSQVWEIKLIEESFSKQSLPQEWTGIHLTRVEDQFYIKSLIISFCVSMLTLLVAVTALFRNLFSEMRRPKNYIRL